MFMPAGHGQRAAQADFERHDQVSGASSSAFSWACPHCRPVGLYLTGADEEFHQGADTGACCFLRDTVFNPVGNF